MCPIDRMTMRMASSEAPRVTIVDCPHPHGRHHMHQMMHLMTCLHGIPVHRGLLQWSMQHPACLLCLPAMQHPCVFWGAWVLMIGRQHEYTILVIVKVLFHPSCIDSPSWQEASSKSLYSREACRNPQGCPPFLKKE